MNFNSSVSTTISITYVSLASKSVCMYVEKIGRVNQIVDIQVLKNVDTENLSDYILDKKSSPELKIIKIRKST